MWDRTDPFVRYNETEFRRNYGFRKSNLLKVVDIVKEDLSHVSDRGKPFSPLEQGYLLID